jgi:hypothetical protein
MKGGAVGSQEGHHRNNFHGSPEPLPWRYPGRKVCLNPSLVFPRWSSKESGCLVNKTLRKEGTAITSVRSTRRCMAAAFGKLSALFLLFLPLVLRDPRLYQFLHKAGR